MLEIAEAQDHQMPLVRELFQEYAKSLDFDLGFQDFDEELSSLPGDYSTPRGRILLARYNGKLAGCVGVRPLSGRIAEMKRLYVKPEFQGHGVGRALAEAVVETARRLGYAKMRLDTVPSMNAALAVYGSLGFRAIPAYRENPIPGAAYFEKDLA